MPDHLAERLLRSAMKRRGLDTLALRALLHATHLLGLALAERLRQYRDSGDAVLDRFARLAQHALLACLHQEAAEILASRWDKLPERQRPHYSPQARFRILRLKSLMALSAEETARAFRVSTGTIHRWEQEAAVHPERTTVGSLLKPVPPVRRFADVVRHVIQTLSVAGFPGDRSVALALARAGWKLSRRTVQRIRGEEPAPPPPAEPAASPRAVRARFPNHVWMLDLTEIPGLFRLFSFKLAVVLDVFSRAPLAAQVFWLEPSARDMARLVRRAARCFGPPRHSVSDRGAQFTSRVFRRTLKHLDIRHRYGAVGRTGSIAILERFFRTLKTTASLAARPPLLRADLELRLAQVFAYYVWLRPHQALEGATPAELFFDLERPHLAAIPPPRGRPGEAVTTDARFELRHLDAEGQLPFLVPKAA